MRKSVEGYLTLFRSAKQYSLVKPETKKPIYFCLNQVVESCFSRLLCTDYSKNEFNLWKQTMKQLELLPLRNQGIKGRIIRIAATNYYCFSLFRVIYKVVFIPFILPRLHRN